MKKKIQAWVEKHTKIQEVLVTGMDQHGVQVTESVDIVKRNWFVQLVWRIFLAPKYKTISASSITWVDGFTARETAKKAQMDKLPRETKVYAH